jgi:hypothetical protein
VSGESFFKNQNLIFVLAKKEKKLLWPMLCCNPPIVFAGGTATVAAIFFAYLFVN